MPADVGLKVEGARELRRQLRDAGDDLEDLKAANAQAAKIAAAAGASRAPVRSGALERSVRSSGTKTAGIVRAGRKSVPYANPIHWGWFKRHIKPHPFLSYGAQESQPQWIKVYELSLDRILDKIKGIA